MLKRALQIVIMSVAAVGGYGFYRWWQIRQKRQPAPSPLSLLRDVAEDATLSRPTDDSLLLTWRRLSTNAEVVIRPMVAIANEESRHYIIVEGYESLTIADVRPRVRYLAEITFDDGSCLTVAERSVPLKSVPNFRDMGGYMTHSGYRVRWNRVYRASRFSNLTPEDSQILAAMGVTLVCDLRTGDEVQAEPDKLPHGIKFEHLPAETTANRWVELGRLLFTPDYLPNLLKNAYCTVMLDQNPQVFKQIFEHLANAENYPIVLHCAAGKDRTGITTMLILSFLGVPDETIIADYTQSNYHYEFFRDTTQRVMLQMQMFGISESDFDYLLIADGDLMQQTLQHVRANYGSIESYLRYAGINAETLERVKQNLLE